MFGSAALISLGSEWALAVEARAPTAMVENFIVNYYLPIQQLKIFGCPRKDADKRRTATDRGRLKYFNEAFRKESKGLGKESLDIVLRKTG